MAAKDLEKIARIIDGLSDENEIVNIISYTKQLGETKLKSIREKKKDELDELDKKIDSLK
jgi:hypothetical protein